MSRQFDYSKNPVRIYNVEEHVNLQDKLGVTVGSRFNSLINGFYETSGFELLRLSRMYWILDGQSRFCHIARVISNAWNVRRLILIRRFRCIYVDFNLRRYNLRRFL